MNAKLPGSKPAWVDPDDAPELTDEMLDKATYKVGERVVSPEEYASALQAATKMGRPKLERPKQPVTIRYDADVIDAFKATGPGWQTRMNDVLREWLRTQGEGDGGASTGQGPCIPFQPGIAGSISAAN